ncbi:hypothetical protein CC77DRAFT_234946 [Alternaria alternata]|uniref:Clr5 domain-containing protein n=1 Tax=Alternaria alternata TaxID=5599 RepID=A0A177DDI2_ALTAL|nr:hypothetical protein CC77DRAFT_234946 [Alternaria alternata]OAG17775.1 hypothetical protein CC77DRAFT_234946 [Alternaria alternata]
MSNTAKTDNIDEKTWEHHRARIESLYWGKSLSAIDAHMREHYAFVASKSQYERQFRKWQLRKNLTGPEWTVIIRYMKRNSIRLEQVEVLFKGHEIPHKRILQEIARRSSLNTTWQSGSYKLPKEITVRPRSRPPDIDAANGLQTTIVPAIIPSLSSIQTEASLELVTIPSISINRYSSNASTLAASWSAPFSWMRSVDLDSFSQNLSAAEQLTKWRKPPKAQLDALFYSKDRSFLDTRHESHETSVPLCAIASLANNLSSVDHNVSNDAYSLLKALPLNVVLQSLKVLPVPVLDALKEQVFATAVKVGDVNLVSAMLKLNADPRERIMIDRSTGSKPTYPLDYARDADHFAVAKTLISHMCQGATQSQLDGLIDYILYGMESTMPESRMYFTRWPIGRFGESKPIELMCIALAAGARPKWDCLRAVYDVILVASLKKLVENTTGGIMAWLEIGLLKFYLGSSYDWTKTSPIENVLQYVFSDCQRQLPRGDPKFRTVVLEGLKTAIVNKKEEAAKMILRAFSLLGYRLNSEETCMGNTATNDLIIQAFDNADWDLATSLMLAQYSTAVGGNLEQGLKATASTAYRSGAQQPVARSFEKPPHVPTYHEQFAGAVKEKNLVLAYQLLQDHKLSSVYMKNFVKLAISLGEFDMIVSIIRSMKDVCSWSSGELYVLLDHGQITAVSALLIGNPVWKSALDAACYNGGFGTLEAMLFQGATSILPGYRFSRHCNRQFQALRMVVADWYGC